LDVRPWRHSEYFSKHNPSLCRNDGLVFFTHSRFLQKRAGEEVFTIDFIHLHLLQRKVLWKRFLRAYSSRYCASFVRSFYWERNHPLWNKYSQQAWLGLTHCKSKWLSTNL